jgi:adenosylmethionine-8-amino-7-oxononanoate aminotransferase
MGNPLSCAVANASIDLLLKDNWQERIEAIEAILKSELLLLIDEPSIADVRVLGAIGVLEFNQPLDMQRTQDKLIAAGVWLRPFGKLLYTMPPFIITETELTTITQAMRSIAQS